MGVVRADGQIAPQRGSELALETLHVGAGETREVGDAAHDVLLFVFAGSGELDGGRLSEGVGGAAARRRGRGAHGCATRHLARADHARGRHRPARADGHPRAARRGERVEPGKATGSRSFQILFGPHNGCRRATLFVGYVPPGKAPWHYHLYDEIVWIWRGPGRYHVGDEADPLEDGTAFRITPRQVHIVENTSPDRELADPRCLHARRQPVRRLPDAGRRGSTRFGTA